MDLIKGGANRSVAFIFARGGSKGLPKKNLKVLGGKPLLGWAIDSAFAVKKFDRVIVSTDDIQIAGVAKEFGAEVPFMRPSELSGDLSPEILAWKHAIHSLESDGYLFDIFASLPATSPFRSSEDLQNCLLEFSKNDSDIVITTTPSDRSPYFNMVSVDQNRNATIMMGHGDTSFTRRQDTPNSHDITTVAYVSSPDYIKKAQSVFDGVVRAVSIPKVRAIDIDTEFDFMIAEYIYESKLYL